MSSQEQKKKDRKMSKKELCGMFEMWLRDDLYKAGVTWNYIEKKDEGFGRGWRSAIYNVITKIKENL